MSYYGDDYGALSVDDVSEFINVSSYHVSHDELKQDFSSGEEINVTPGKWRAVKKEHVTSHELQMSLGTGSLLESVIPSASNDLVIPGLDGDPMEEHPPPTHGIKHNTAVQPDFVDHSIKIQPGVAEYSTAFQPRPNIVEHSTAIQSNVIQHSNKIQPYFVDQSTAIQSNVIQHSNKIQPNVVDHFPDTGVDDFPDSMLYNTQPCYYGTNILPVQENDDYLLEITNEAHNIKTKVISPSKTQYVTPEPIPLNLREEYKDIDFSEFPPVYTSLLLHGCSEEIAEQFLGLIEEGLLGSVDWVGDATAKWLITKISRKSQHQDEGLKQFLDVFRDTEPGSPDPFIAFKQMCQFIT